MKIPNQYLPHVLHKYWREGLGAGADGLPWSPPDYDDRGWRAKQQAWSRGWSDGKLMRSFRAFPDAR